VLLDDKYRNKRLRKKAAQYVYVVSEGQSIQPQLQFLIKLRVKEEYLFYMHLTASITFGQFNGINVSVVI
jgi:hypothetical protein